MSAGWPIETSRRGAHLVLVGEELLVQREPRGKHGRAAEAHVAREQSVQCDRAALREATNYDIARAVRQRTRFGGHKLAD